MLTSSITIITFYFHLITNLFISDDKWLLLSQTWQVLQLGVVAKLDLKRQEVAPGQMT